MSEYKHVEKPALEALQAMGYRYMTPAAVDALRPGGVVILEAFRPAQIDYGTGGPPDAALMYTAEDLRADFAELDVEHLDETEIELSAGHGHRGTGAVVQMVARK